MKRTILAAAILLAGIASAGAVDFKTPIRAIDGTTIPVSETDKTPITLGKVLVDAMVATVPGENVPTEEKSRRFFLALKIHEGKRDLTAEEVALAKKVVGSIYGPLVVGRVTELLDPASVPAEARGIPAGAPGNLFGQSGATPK